MHKVTILCDTYIPNPDCIGEIQIGNYYWEVEYYSDNITHRSDLCEFCIVKFVRDFSNPNLHNFSGVKQIHRYQA